MLTIEMMHRRWPHANQHVPGLAEGIVRSAPAVFSKFGVADKPMAVAHFMAQASEECGQGLEMWEDMNYTAERLREIFPTHFTPTMAARWAHNPRMIANIAYGGRKELGNAPLPSDDGWNFRGRGLSQVTGREGYQRLHDSYVRAGVDLDIMGNPDFVCEPGYALEMGVADWVLCGCLPHAIADNVLRETEALNGGTNGLAERVRQLASWKREFGL